MTIDTIASKIFFGYFALVGVMFVAMNQSAPGMVNDMVHVDKSGNMVGNSYPKDKLGTISDLGLTVGTIYCQVIGTMAIMAANAVFFEGSKYRTFMSQLPLVAVMAKHIVVDGLIPPAPVMALGAVTLGAGAAVAFGTDGTGTDYGKYMFIIQNALNLVVFVLDPAQVVKDTWTDISGAPLGIGVLFVGVLQLYCAMFIVLFLFDSPLSQFICMTLGMGQLYRDVFLNDSGPPMPVLVLFVGVFLASVYGMVQGKPKGKTN